MAMKAYIGQPLLPPGYTLLEYIQSSGSQFINTNHKATNNTRVICDFQLLNNNLGQSVFGCWAFASDYSILGAFLLQVQAENYISFWYSNAATDFSTSVNILNRHTVDCNKNVGTIDGSYTATNNTATFSSEYPIYLFGGNFMNSLNQGCALKMWSAKIYEGSVLKRNFIPCKNASNEIGMFDTVSQTFFKNSGSGTFIAGTSKGYPELAQPVKKMYLGVNNIAQRIRKGYIGINNIARPFWSDVKQVAYYGQISGGLTGKIEEPSAASVGNYAVFAGINNGTSGTSYNKDVNAFNSSLTRTKAASCTNGYLHNFAGASNGTHAVFEGGQYSATTLFYDANLTQKSVSHGYSVRGFPGCGFNGYAFFYGGYNYTTTIRGYNSSLTKKTLSASYSSCDAGMCIVGNYMLIGGGENGGSTVNAFNKSFTRSTPTALPFSKRRLCGASVGEKYGLFAGGCDNNYGSGSITTVASYNTSLTRSTATALTKASYDFASVSTPSYAVFFENSGYTDSYDENLTKVQRSGRGSYSNSNAAAMAGKYAITTGSNNAVEAYLID